MTQLEILSLSSNPLTTLSAQVERLTALRMLNLDWNCLRSLPRELGRLRSLLVLDVDTNALESIPSELANLQALQSLYVCTNKLCWLPFDLDRLPATTIVRLYNNPLPLRFRRDENARHRLLELFAETTHIGMIRDRATVVCNALQDLELPAPLTLEIIDAMCPNNIRMWAKWELITTVKHFHQRRSVC
jgi:hypothetical protein